MKHLEELIDRGRALCGQIVSALFDAGDTKTTVERFMESVETDSSSFGNANRHVEEKSRLYTAPDEDFYMGSSTDSVKEQTAKLDVHLEDEVKAGSSQGLSPDDGLKENILCELAGLIEELKRLDSQTTDENVTATIGFCENRIVEIMISSGCEPIDNELTFDNSRHVPSPYSFIEDGCEISKIVKPGLSYKNKVLVKAIVECKQ